ncbi:Ig-like domain-containing protein [Paenibacillus alba]|uniref:dockerin type I domain-containing protein n=1 Tax=Paenibacillus alba TaxID=1197127 RepID=UPI001565EDF0|nr:Ig-like domain-containing protein [Paenibacillus alba]NQX68587.1 Ig-like domain-containing protein [Paenibacillus alba]
MHLVQKNKTWKLAAQIGMLTGALALAIPFASLSLPVQAQTVKVKPIFTNSMSWAPRDAAADTESTFNFNVSDRFNGCTGLSLVSSAPGSATGSLNGFAATIKVNAPGTPVFTLSGTDTQGNLVTDTFQVEINKLGDFTGDGVVTTADALFISRYLSGKVFVSEDEILMMDINGDGVITNADAVALTSLYVGGSGSGSGVLNYTAIFRDINDVPIARSVSLDGQAEIGQPLTGNYTYFDVEKTTEGPKNLQWYIGSKADGSDKVPISGAVTSTYTVREADVGNYLFFGVTPVELGGLAGKQVISAASAKVEDASVPVATLMAPVNGQVNVDPGLSALSITLSKNITATDKHIQIRKLSDNTILADYAANDTTKITINGNKIDILVTGLQESADYYVEIEAGAFKDVWNHPFAGLNGSSAWKFSTWDKTPPEIAVLTPSNHAASVDAALSSISVTFDENVSAISGKQVIIRQSADHLALATYTASDTNSINVNGKVVTVSLPPLAENTGYYVEIEAGAFTDASNNPFAGLTSSSAWSFTTSAVTVAATVTAETDPVSLTENNLDAALITLSVTGDTFKAAADEADFQLNNAPPGLSIALAYVDNGKAYLLLEHDWHVFSGDITNFSVTAKASALTKGVAATSNSMTITAVPQTLNPFFSEYLDGGDGRIALAIYYPGNGQPSDNAIGYEVEVQQYMKAAKSIRSNSRSLFPISPTMPFIMIDTIFYDAFDLLNITYFNDDIRMYDPSTYVTTALLLKKNGQVIDVLGTPNATSATSILPGGGILTRKSGTKGGMTTFALNHWAKTNMGPTIFKKFNTFTP